MTDLGPSSRRLSIQTVSISLALSLVAGACDLTEVSLTEPEPNVVVEAYARILPAGGGSIFAFLHGSVGVIGANSHGPEALVRVVAENGTEVILDKAPTKQCTYGSSPDPDPGRCYAGTLAANFVRPSDRLVLKVDVLGGGLIEGGTTVPGSFGWTQPTGSEACMVTTGPVEFGWTPSDDTWAYIVDVMLTGVAPGLISLGVDNPSDSAVFNGLTISRDETTIAFPEDFSIDDGSDYEWPLARLVEDGIQPGWAMHAYVMAIDRNFTNWVRGDAGFNPSGIVRIPSLRGEGTGVFGSGVLLTRRIAGSPSGCP